MSPIVQRGLRSGRAPKAFIGVMDIRLKLIIIACPICQVIFTVIELLCCRMRRRSFHNSPVFAVALSIMEKWIPLLMLSVPSLGYCCLSRVPTQWSVQGCLTSLKRQLRDRSDIILKRAPYLLQKPNLMALMASSSRLLGDNSIFYTSSPPDYLIVKVACVECCSDRFRTRLRRPEWSYSSHLQSV